MVEWPLGGVQLTVMFAPELMELGDAATEYPSDGVGVGVGVGVALLPTVKEKSRKGQLFAHLDHSLTKIGPAGNPVNVFEVFRP